LSFRRCFALLAFALAVACARSVAPSQAHAHARIVTLIPSFAEDVIAVGAGAQLVAVSKFSDDIRGTAGLPVVADVQSVDVERIVALHPDVVAGIPSQARLVAPLERAGIRVVLIRNDSFDDIFTDLRELGELTGHPAVAGAVIARLQAQTARLHATIARRAAHPTVFVALGTTPIWTAGKTSYIARLIELAGGRDAASDLSAPWGEYSEEALLRAQPDAIVAGRDTDLSSVRTRQPWRSLRAMREDHVFSITDPRIDNALFRPGPRYNEGLRWLIERLSSLSTRTTPTDRSNPSS
jgi:ABC-type Fe3+-hydroxamate transport system substrate-binding protein